jgi:hypothetical protein
MISDLRQLLRDRSYRIHEGGSMFRYRLVAIPALTLTMTAAQSSNWPVAPVSPAGAVVFQVNSLPSRPVKGQMLGPPIEFSVHALGAGLKRSVDFERKTTPTTVTVPGRDVSALFRQIGGNGILFVEIRPTRNKSCQVASPVSMLIVRGDNCGGAFTDPRVDSLTRLNPPRR